MARKLCPDLVVVEPHYDRYAHFSRMAQEIYESYTGQVEAFGLDESWLDVTEAPALDPGGAVALADRIRARIRFELGITASVGVSFNKVFAKLGSDRRKPDATTCISEENWQDTVWPLPVTELLYVGSATGRLLQRNGVRTIGELARTRPAVMKGWLGKCGEVLWAYANGLDRSRVCQAGEVPAVKSIGNSTTPPRDLTEERDLKITLYILCESVAERLREQGLQCDTVQVSLRGTDLVWCQRQAKLSAPTQNTKTIYDAAHALCREHGRGRPLRSLGVRACGLEPWGAAQQSLFEEVRRSQRRDDLDRAVDGIRRRFGRDSVRRGIMLADPAMAALDPRQDHPQTLAGPIRQEASPWHG